MNQSGFQMPHLLRPADPYARIGHLRNFHESHVFSHHDSCTLILIKINVILGGTGGALQQDYHGFKPLWGQGGPFLSGGCMFLPCQRWFSSGTLASSITAQTCN